jgi:hypothetical protein
MRAALQASLEQNYGNPGGNEDEELARILEMSKYQN